MRLRLPLNDPRNTEHDNANPGNQITPTPTTSRATQRNPPTRPPHRVGAFRETPCLQSRQPNHPEHVNANPDNQITPNTATSRATHPNPSTRSPHRIGTFRETPCLQSRQPNHDQHDNANPGDQLTPNTTTSRATHRNPPTRSPHRVGAFRETPCLRPQQPNHSGHNNVGTNNRNATKTTTPAPTTKSPRTRQRQARPPKLTRRNRDSMRLRLPLNDPRNTEHDNARPGNQIAPNTATRPNNQIPPTTTKSRATHPNPPTRSPHRVGAFRETPCLQPQPPTTKSRRSPQHSARRPNHTEHDNPKPHSPNAAKITTLDPIIKARRT